MNTMNTMDTMSTFPMPTDSEFILAQGRMAQEKRRRGVSDARIPFAMSTITCVVESTAGRRRNTVSAASLSSLASPPLSPSSPSISPSPRVSSTSASHMLSAMFNKDKQRVAPLLVGKMANILPPQARKSEIKEADDSHMMFFSPLTPPISPPVYTEHGYAHTSVSPPLSASLQSRSISSLDMPIYGNVAAWCEGCYKSPTAESAGQNQMQKQTHETIQLFLLDSKKIRLARPRLVCIGSSEKQ
ncbi:hypothetical protein BX661DRAFT_176062 [Kickxella alabastrina]|uniref:uncharacterized protein n=1 Tax=Kickxella alabastrina TaxID=61397 RepID=UPI0022210390|nr:uncharacterized protein BX661DRAFT_176062 [Kickxella alabastrina]KAI7835088.1 hypothetical protein BX661DRAFT_176062 [Kickxella alabastrina]